MSQSPDISRVVDEIRSLFDVAFVGDFSDQDWEPRSVRRHVMLSEIVWKSNVFEGAVKPLKEAAYFGTRGINGRRLLAAEASRLC